MSNDERTASILEDLSELCEPDARDERFRGELADLLLAAASTDAGRLGIGDLWAAESADFAL